MKREFKLSTLISRFCIAFLALFGYGCESSCMYGTPTGSWEIKGEVTEESSDAYPAATIKVTKPNVNSSEYSITETRTDEQGRYDVKWGGWPESSLKVVCLPDDQTLKPDSTVVNLKYSSGKKKDEWYVGSAEATADFKLKKKGD